MNGDNLNFENDENINNDALYQYSNNIKNQFMGEEEHELENINEEEKNNEQLENYNEEDLNINLNNNNNYMDINGQSNLSNIEKISINNNSIYSNSFLSRRLNQI